ncbi:MAG: hypothetical protein ACRBFS_12005 [Aureispira sp.]
MNDNLLLDDGFNEKKLDNNNDIAEANRLRRDLNESIKVINRGKYAVFMTIGLLTFGSVIEVVEEPDLFLDSLIGYVIIVLLYTIGLLLFKKNSAASLGICLGVYILFNVLIAVFEPGAAFQGFLIKGLLIYFYANGIYQATQLSSKIEALKAVSLTREDMDSINNYKELPKIHYLK